MNGVLIKSRSVNTEALIQGKYHLKTKAEIRVTLPQVKKVKDG